MQIVLLERVQRLGQMGDIVDVRPGYARNYLLPQGKALRATQGNLERFERDRADIEARNLARKAEAEAVRDRLGEVRVALVRQAAETGNLYGSVTSRDIAEGLRAEGVQVERGQLVLERAIKSLGLHEVRIVLHPEVATMIEVNVARSLEEAELQAQGRTLSDIDALRDGDPEDDFADEANETDEIGGAGEPDEPVKPEDDAAAGA